MPILPMSLRSSPRRTAIFRRVRTLERIAAACATSKEPLDGGNLTSFRNGPLSLPRPGDAEFLGVRFQGVDHQLDVSVGLNGQPLQPEPDDLAIDLGCKRLVFEFLFTLFGWSEAIPSGRTRQQATTKPVNSSPPPSADRGPISAPSSRASGGRRRRRPSPPPLLSEPIDDSTRMVLRPAADNRRRGAGRSDPKVSILRARPCTAAAAPWRFPLPWRACGATGRRSCPGAPVPAGVSDSSDFSLAGRITEAAVDGNHLPRDECGGGRDEKSGRLGHVAGLAPAVNDALLARSSVANTPRQTPPRPF